MRRLLALAVLVMVGCSDSEPLSKSPAEQANEINPSIKRETNEAQTIGPEVQTLLDQASPYFDSDFKNAWNECQQRSIALNAKQINTNPLEILQAAVDTMKRGRYRPDGRKSFGNFLHVYESARESGIEIKAGEVVSGVSHPLTNAEAVENLAHYRKVEEPN